MTSVIRWRNALMVMGLCAIPLVAGINWKAVWLEKPGSKVFLNPEPLRRI